MNYLDGVIDWIIILSIFEIYHIFKVKNEKTLLKREVIYYLIQFIVLLLIGFLEKILGKWVSISLFVTGIIICMICAKKLNEEKKIEIFNRMIVLMGICAIMVLTDVSF